MKKLCILLLLAAIGKTLPAQVTYYYNPPPVSETMFNSPLPGTAGTRFDFILPHNNRMIVEVHRLAHLQQLPDLDSLFKKIWADLKPIYDSLSDPLMVHRVDYLGYGTDTRIRIKKYPPRGTYYSYKDDELVQLKVDQDTLRFKGYIDKTVNVRGRAIQFAFNYYTVTLVLNNISDVTRIPDGMLASGIKLLLPDLGPSIKKSPNKTNYNFYYAAYDLSTGKRVSPVRLDNLEFGKKHGFAPYAQVAIQYARGAWVPSAGAGIEYYYNKMKYSKFAMRLIWEPHFYFQRDDKDKVVLQRNDFITLRFQSMFKNSVPGNNFEFNQNFSFGALIHREGDLFEKGTFKFGLPGLQTKNILLEPEFFFNDFFRHFSPSLKLLVNLD